MEEISFELFEAMIKDIQWRNKVASLLGHEWDLEGSNVINYCWSICYDRYGEAGCDHIESFCKDGFSSFYINEKGYHTDYIIKSLYNSLETYFI